jgi:HK97 family phage prohead protease
VTLAQLIGTKQARVQFEFKDMGDEAGTVRAVFSTFDIEDRDGDIIRHSAFADQDGKEIPLVWSHNWAMPVGKGKVTIQEDRAIFDGKFFLDTNAGQEAYKSVRNMGALQEWSMGFQIKEAKPTDPDAEDDFWYWGGLDITKAELFEVSPVLVGANPQTHTLAVKGGDLTVTASGSTARRIEKSVLGIVADVATESEPADETPPVEAATGKSFSDQLDEALAALDEVVERGESIQAMRAKADRSISAENVSRLEALSERLKSLMSAAQPGSDAAERRRKDMALRARRAQLQARLHTMGDPHNE